jgi:hypothetical protein
MPEVVRLMVREQLTGAPPPPAARQICDLWRPVLEDKVRQAARDLEKHLEDQAAYGDAIRSLLRDLDVDLGEQSPNETGDSDDEESGEDDDAQDGEQDGEGTADASADAMADAAESVPGDEQMGDMIPDDADSEMLPAPGSEEPGEPGTPWRPEHDLSNLPREPFYTAYTEAFDEVVQVLFQITGGPADRIPEDRPPQVANLACRGRRRRAGQFLPHHQANDLGHGRLGAVLDTMQALPAVAFLHRRAKVFAYADHPSRAKRLAARLFQRLEQRGRDIAARRQPGMELAVVVTQLERRGIRLAPHLRNLARRQIAAGKRHARAVTAQTRRFVGEGHLDIVALRDGANRRRRGLLETFEG